MTGALEGDISHICVRYKSCRERVRWAEVSSPYRALQDCSRPDSSLAFVDPSPRTDVAFVQTPPRSSLKHPTVKFGLLANSDAGKDAT